MLKKLLLFVVPTLLLTAVASAQVTPGAPTLTSLPNNIYAFGPTFNPNATPVISGTAFYGRKLDDKGTYAIAGMDIMTGSTAPFTVTSNPFTGVAQQFYSSGRLHVFATPSAGLSYSGTNTGYSYALGGLIVYDLSPSYALGFGGRAFKSNISNSGYEPAVSLEFILKQ